MVSANELFAGYLSDALGEDNAGIAIAALEEPASVSVRWNPSKLPADIHDRMSDLARVPWSEYGMMLDSRPVFTLDPLFHAGCYYVQDSSAMYPGYLLRSVIGAVELPSAVRVLDLCAAPGGKTTDAAASLRSAFGDSFLLVSNEVVRSRASVLASNVAVWGDPCVAVCSADPAGFGNLKGFFDIVIADVPCSGEGMFRKDEEAVAQWSADNVAYCAARQKRIIADVWPALSEGGYLIYSTCTFNRFENDDNVRWISDNLGAEIIYPEKETLPPGVLATEYGCCLVPGLVKGEGQYCAVLKKTAPQPRMDRTGRPPRQEPSSGAVQDFFTVPVSVSDKNGLLKAVPSAIAAEMSYAEDKLKMISSGCAAFTRKGRDLVPHPDLALNIRFRKEACPAAETDRNTALKFLHRDSLALHDMEKGYVLICHDGMPLGFVKNLGNRCNSLMPQERRIRMDVE